MSWRDALDKALDRVFREIKNKESTLKARDVEINNKVVRLARAMRPGATTHLCNAMAKRGIYCITKEPGMQVPWSTEREWYALDKNLETCPVIGHFCPYCGVDLDVLEIAPEEV